MILYAYVAGPDPRHTAAPGDDPLACATSGCHTGSPRGGPINPAGGSVTATFSSGNTYAPGGSPITITVTVSDPVNKHYGFQMTARLDSDQANGQAGDFTPGPNQIVLCDNGVPKGGNGCPASAPVQFIEHTNDAFLAAATAFTFTWTPPATNAGPVHFYVAGNAVNNNYISDVGDRVYTNSYVLAPLVVFVCTNTSIPVITSVNSLTDEGGFSTFAAGSWLEIKGVNLADPSDPRLLQNGGDGIWHAADFNGPNAPTKLDGISAKINGKDAFVYFISPTQIDVLAPADSAVGPVPITVTNCNATSSPTSVTKAALVPGMLAPEKFKVGGKQYLVALFQDNVTFVGNTGLLPGANFRPAKPGEVITAYGIGFGDVTPSFPPGVTATAANSLVNSLAILFDQTPATVQYFGIAPGNTSFYQFNIVVPDVPDGDHQINVTVGGVTVPQTLFLTVHR